MSILLVLVLLQEGEIESLIERLSHEEILVREKAGKRLIEIGPPAVQALRRAAEGSDAEAAARSRSILGEIEIAENRRVHFGGPFRVRIAAGTYRLSEIAESVERQTGVKLRIPESRGASEVAIESRELLLWEFVDRLCGAHGGLALPFRQPEGAIELVEGKPSGAPVFYSGQFRVSLERLELEDRNPYGAAWRRGSMLFAVAWQPNVRPIAGFDAAPQVRLSKLEAEKGVALAVEPRMSTLYGGFQMGYRSDRVHRQFIPFERPQPGTKRLSRISGHVQIRFPLRYATIEIKDPLDAVGAVREAGKYSIQLKECERREGEVRALLRIAIPEEEETGRDRSLPATARIRARDVECVDEAGQVHQGDSDGRGTSSGDGEDVLELPVTFRTEGRPAALRLRFMQDYFEKRVEFEFRDVELP